MDSPLRRISSHTGEFSGIAVEFGGSVARGRISRRRALHVPNPPPLQCILPTSCMLSQLLIAWLLLSSNVVIHAYGVTLALRWGRPHSERSRQLRFGPSVFIRLAGWIVLLHVIEITVWAGVYELAGAMKDIQSALYFSAVTYTTTGYGDLVLPQDWRLVGAVEALTGILMCGWSTGFFFAVVSRGFSGRENSA